MVTKMKTKHLIFILGMTALLSGSYLIGKTIEASKESPRVTAPVIRPRKTSGPKGGS